MAVEIWAHRGNVFNFGKHDGGVCVGAGARGRRQGLMCILPAINRLWLPMMRASRESQMAVAASLTKHWPSCAAIIFIKQNRNRYKWQNSLLAEVLELVKPTQAMINIEIKSGIVLYEGIEKAVWALVRDFGMQDRVLYSSFNHFSLTTLKQIDSHTKNRIVVL